MPKLLPNYIKENPRNEQDEESKFEINSQETIIHANNQDKEPYFENPDYQKNYKICYRKSNTQIKKNKRHRQ